MRVPKPTRRTGILREVNGQAAARAWVDAWERGWRAHDVELIAERYAECAVFRSHPFRELEDARAYVERIFADEEAEPEVWFSEPIVEGDRAAVEYWAILRAEGNEQTLAGTTLLRFDDDGLVVEHRDYWALESERRERPATS
jgi:ketosteroid isomerase-like protein